MDKKVPEVEEGMRGILAEADTIYRGRGEEILVL